MNVGRGRATKGSPTNTRDLSAIGDVQSSNVAAVLNRDERIEWCVVESENFESIHNHSAYALIEKDKLAK